MTSWIAAAALLFSIFVTFGGVIWKLAQNKDDIFEKMQGNRDVFKGLIEALRDEIGEEIDAIRTASFIEYKEMRGEFTSAIAKAYLELGEGPKSLREKVNQIEIWMRDHFLLKTDYERDQDHLLAAIKSLGEVMDRRFTNFEKKMEGVQRRKEEG